jgi:hypothetical protein
MGDFFAGRTILYTHAWMTGSPPGKSADFENEALDTIIHEFVHAFGMPHQCGYWDWRTPRTNSCAMNYPGTWLIDAAHKPLPRTHRKRGTHLCVRHVTEVRRVHIEKNKGLNW